PAKKRVKAKKTPVPKPKTPRNDASLRAPPRAVNAFSLYLKQTFPTLQPKPKSAPEGLAQIRVKWTGLSDTEKKRYEEEAQKVTAERRKVYDEWRSKLSLSEVQSINKYRKAHGHSKLGQPGTSKRPLSSWMIFLKRFVASGEVKPPSGEPAAPFYAREAAKRWKALTKAEKDVCLQILSDHSNMAIALSVVVMSRPRRGAALGAQHEKLLDNEEQRPSLHSGRPVAPLALAEFDEDSGELEGSVFGEESPSSESDAEDNEIMQNSYREIFSSIPDAAQVAQARLRISKLSKEYSEVEAEYEAQRSLMDQLENRLEVARRKLFHERASIASIRRLPQELLSMIFAIHVHEHEESTWALMHVSRSWRATALLTGSLWSRIMLTSKWASTKTEHRSRSFKGREVCVKNSHVRRALARAGGTPLDLYIYISPNTQAPVIRPHIWIDILTDGDRNRRTQAISSMLRCFSYGGGPKPKLRSLEIDTSHRFRFPMAPFSVFDFTALEQLKLDQCYSDIVDYVNTSTCKPSSLGIPSPLIPKLLHEHWTRKVSELKIIERLPDPPLEPEKRVIGASRRLIEACAGSLTSLSLQGFFSGPGDAIMEPRIETPLLERLELDRVKYFWPVECHSITHLRLVLAWSYGTWEEKIFLPQLVDFECVVAGGPLQDLLHLDMPKLYAFRLRMSGGKSTTKSEFNTLWSPKQTGTPNIDPVVFILEGATILPQALGACLATLTRCEELQINRAIVDNKFFEEIQPKAATVGPNQTKTSGTKGSRKKAELRFPLPRLHTLDISMERTKSQPNEPQLIKSAKDFLALRTKAGKSLKVMRINLPSTGLTEMMNDGDS
ncbi:hypothetical protein FRC17_003290, partial [Serendipita sp. 399]